MRRTTTIRTNCTITGQFAPPFLVFEHHFRFLENSFQYIYKFANPKIQKSKGNLQNLSKIGTYQKSEYKIHHKTTNERQKGQITRKQNHNPAKNEMHLLYSDALKAKHKLLLRREGKAGSVEEVLLAFQKRRDIPKLA